MRSAKCEVRNQSGKRQIGTLVSNFHFGFALRIWHFLLPGDSVGLFDAVSRRYPMKIVAGERQPGNISEQAFYLPHSLGVPNIVLTDRSLVASYRDRVRFDFNAQNL